MDDGTLRSEQFSRSKEKSYADAPLELASRHPHEDGQSESAIWQDFGRHGFQAMIRYQALLPHSLEDKSLRHYKRCFNERWEFIINAGHIYHGKGMVPVPLPYGVEARIAMFYFNWEALRNHSRKFDMGNAFVECCRYMRLSDGEDDYNLLLQMLAVSMATYTLGYVWHDLSVFLNKLIACTYIIDNDILTDNKYMYCSNSMFLSKEYFARLQEEAIPIPMEVVAGLPASCMAMDVLVWLTHRLPQLAQPMRLSFTALKEQFGPDCSDSQDFQNQFLKAIADVVKVYPGAKVEQVDGGIVLCPSKPLK